MSRAQTDNNPEDAAAIAMPAVAGRGVQSVEIGGRLLNSLVLASQPMMLRDLAQAAELTPGQAHAYLVSFRKLGLVEQDAASGRYRLGPFALHLGLARLRNTDPYRLAATAVVDLAEQLELMVTITVWGHAGPTIVLVQESSNQIHANVRPGGLFTVSGTATGKVFAAYLPRKLVEPVLAAELATSRKGWSATSDMAPEELLAEFERVRRAGLCTTVDNPVPGVSALAAPIFDHTGRIMQVITVIGPTAKVDVSPEGGQAQALLAFTRRLSAELGYSG
ncbi:IclR family transcriptional regulator [Ferrovibrio sp.]|uniref:IclR family transcriptional regulator n=1 Tax=Ferrovibrio sp. TaxID=1917215 RepID=UPI001B5AEBAF|nr:IclR family transcriptional regulator [Ferrovibrio sp.]MBP7064305.1 IclR family transcriptional regulator [Ferrovibrio sp.]